MIDEIPHAKVRFAPRCEALVQQHQLPSKPEVIKKVSDQVPALTALIDLWWQGVARDLTGFTLPPPWRRWVNEVLLPRVYLQVSKSGWIIDPIERVVYVYRPREAVERLDKVRELSGKSVLVGFVLRLRTSGHDRKL
jgi:hypothetical protein